MRAHCDTASWREAVWRRPAHSLHPGSCEGKERLWVQVSWYLNCWVYVYSVFTEPRTRLHAEGSKELRCCKLNATIGTDLKCHAQLCSLKHQTGEPEKLLLVTDSRLLKQNLYFYSISKWNILNSISKMKYSKLIFFTWNILGLTVLVVRW